MASSPKVLVYLACSLDGFIAGPDNDLEWLHAPGPAPDAPAPPSDALGFEALMAQTGAMLMGRHTHDVVAGFGAWPYGDCPVLVSTHRPLTPAHPTVRAVSGDIVSLIAEAKAAAGPKDVYLDGGALVRQALDAGLVDELILTFVPILLTAGVSLFTGLTTRRRLQFTAQHPMANGMLQVRATVLPPG